MPILLGPWERVTGCLRPQHGGCCHPPWKKGDGGSSMEGGWLGARHGGRRGLLSSAQDEATATPGQHPFLDALCCPTTSPSPTARGKPFWGAGAPDGRVGGSEVCSRGTGVHPNLLPWKRQRLGGGGKRRLQQPRDADKGEGEGSLAAAGGGAGCSQHPLPGAHGRDPLSSSRGGGRHSLPSPTPHQPLAPLPAQQPHGCPHRLPGRGQWGDPSQDPSRDPGQNWVHGAGAVPDKISFCSYFVAPTAPAKDSPDSHQHHSAH